MDDALLMRMLYPSAYRNKKLQPLPHRKLLALAVIGKLLSHDQFHHEKRPTRFCRCGVQHPGDVGVVHHGQRLPFRVEALEHGLCVHPRFDEFERDLAFDRLGLLGDPDLAHAAFADLFDEGVAASDDGAGFGVRAVVAGRHLLGRRIVGLRSELTRGQRRGRRRTIQQAAGRLVRRQERLDGGPELRLPGAGFLQKGSALGWGFR